MKKEKRITCQQQRKEKYDLLEQDFSFRMVMHIARLMDHWCLDPIVGFLFPGVGDLLSTVMTLPFFYVSLFKIRSIPLTIAMTYNILLDMLIGLIPWAIGDLLDIFNRSYNKNYKLIVGFVENDKAVIKNVNQRAVFMGVVILVLIFLIYGLSRLVYTLFAGGWDLLASCFH